jgi:superfamily II DNA or RNA helicase
MSEHRWPDEFWPNQIRICDGVLKAARAGRRRIVVTSPTGTGKTRAMAALIQWAKGEWLKSGVYTNRRLLFSQLSGVLSKLGIDHGHRAAGYRPALLRDVQLAMTQSEASATTRGSRELHAADLVLSDELHCQGGETLPKFHQAHHDSGAIITGWTATPIDLVGDWDELVVGGTTSDGRKCGALVPAYTYCPDEPDLKHIKNYRVGDDLTDKENRKVMMRPGVFGRVLKHYRRLNPDDRPTILFGPDVAGSIYFAEQFYKAGVPSAHIDAKQVWCCGESYPSDDEVREDVLDRLRSGEIKVCCNRFVLREGIDLPEVAHAVFACVFGSLRTYVQAGGRALRSHPSIDSVCIQDHGGNFVRHGSLNEDRSWYLGQTGNKTTGMRIDEMRESPEKEPIICPECGFSRLRGEQCPACGHRHWKRSRHVVQINGELKLVDGPSFRKHRRKTKPDTKKLWERMYHRARSKRWNATFRQAEAMFFVENHYYPPRDLPLMPESPADWYEKVGMVPKERLQ